MNLGLILKTSSMPLVAVAALLIGLIVGRLTSEGYAVLAADQTTGSPDLMATATRESELAELSELRTQVAQTPEALVCTVAATNTPEPTATETATATPVPPTAAGQPVAYSENWTVTVVDISLMPTFANYTADGTFAKVSLAIVNNTESPTRFPYDDLVLRDSQGRAFIPDPSVKALNEAGYFSPFPPSLPTDGFVVFDISADAEGPFILESTADPFFRVIVEVAVRG